MKKFGYVIAALSAIAIAAPSIASAETVVVSEGGHRHFGRSHAMFRDTPRSGIGAIATGW